MAGISNSSIQPWLDLDLNADNLPATITPCQNRQKGGRIVLGNCTTVCDDAGLLLYADQPNSLLTCGLWATLATLTQYAFLTNDYHTLLGRFDSLGLDAGNATYAYAARNAVSTAMNTMLKITKVQTYQGGSSLEGACSEQALFPTSTLELDGDLPQFLRTCVNAICAPRTLNPDLGGIGVRISP